MAVGLGFANPELLKARRLALLNGSTALPTGQGAPLSAPMTQQPPMAAQARPMLPQDMPVQPPQAAPPPPESVQQIPLSIPQQAPQAKPKPEEDLTFQGFGEKTPKWGKIVGALGHVLLSIDAGMRGGAQPDLPDYLDPQKEQDQDMQVAEFLINTTAQAWEASRKAPPRMRRPLMENYKAAIQRVAPEFDMDKFIGSMGDDADWVDDIAPEIATMSEDAKKMFMAQVRARGGDPAEAAAGVMKDRQFMTGLFDFEDQRGAAALKYKLTLLNEGFAKTGTSAQALGLGPDNFDALNEQLPEKFQLTPSEKSIMKRHPEYWRLLGVRTKEDEDPSTLEGAAGYRPRRDMRPKRKPVAAPPPGRPDEEESPEQDSAPPAPPTPPRRPQAPPPRPAQQPAAAKPRAPAQRQPAPSQPPRTTTTYDRQTGKPVRQTQRPSQGGEQVLTAPRDMKFRNLGTVKKGERLIYDYATKSWRRA